MTGDPRVVEGARNVGEITVDELRNLSFRGAKSSPPPRSRIKSEGATTFGWSTTSTETSSAVVLASRGQFESLIDMREEPLACLTIAGRAIRNRPGILSELANALRAEEVNVDAVASGMDSVTFYVDVDVAETAEALLHESVVTDDALSSVTVADPIAVIRITGGELPNQSGVIQDIIAPVADAGINIIDLITSATSVAVFVDWDDREEALEIVQGRFD